MASASTTAAPAIDKHAIASPTSAFPSPSSSFVPPPHEYSDTPVSAQGAAPSHDYSALKRKSLMGTALNNNELISPLAYGQPAWSTSSQQRNSIPSLKRQSAPDPTGVVAGAVSQVSATSTSSGTTTASPATPPNVIPIPALSSSPHSSASSSPSTTAFVTPASSLAASDHPSTPSSPSLATAVSSTVPGYVSTIAMSTRPAPPSPAMSRRQSTKSSTSLFSRPNSGPVSRPASGMQVGTLAPPAFIMSTISQDTKAEEPASEPPLDPKPAIIIRDYAFPSTDDRFHGLGPFVPKWNRVERLTRLLVDAAKDDEESREKRERRKRRKESKAKKRLDANGWSDSDSGGRNDSGGWSSGRSSSDSDSAEGMDEDDGDDDQHPSSAMYADASGSSAWARLRMGRLSTHYPGLNIGGINESEGNGDAEFPSRMDLDRNFGAEEDDEGYQQNDYEDYQDEEPDGPLLPGLYRALYAFEPEGAAEMGLDEDQVVRVVGRGGGVGWAVVVDEREGREGSHALVPESYLEVVTLDSEDYE